MNKSNGGRIEIDIEGLERKFYTGDKSSDNRAKFNIIADIRRQFRIQGLDPMQNKPVFLGLPKDEEPEELELKPQQTEPTEIEPEHQPEQQPEPDYQLQSDFIDMTEQTDFSEQIEELVSPKIDFAKQLESLTESPECHSLDVFKLLSFDALDTISNLVTKSKHAKKQDAILAAAELIEESGVSIKDVASVLGEKVPQPEPTENPQETRQQLSQKSTTSTANTPTKHKKKADRKKVQEWMREELSDNPKLTAKFFTNRWETKFPDYLQPPYQTVYTWLTAVRSKLDSK